MIENELSLIDHKNTMYGCSSMPYLVLIAKKVINYLLYQSMYNRQNQHWEYVLYEEDCYSNSRFHQCVGPILYTQVVASPVNMLQLLDKLRLAAVGQSICCSSLIYRYSNQPRHMLQLLDIQIQQLQPSQYAAAPRYAEIQQLQSSQYAATLQIN